MAKFESIESVQKSIELQKGLLQTTDDSIKRITGRSPDNGRRNNPDLSSGPPRRFVANGAPPSVFSRLNPNLGNFRESKFSQLDKPETDLHVSLPSSVVRVGEKRSRLDAIKEYNTMDKGRGRRMFGVLQATLTQFKAESSGGGNNSEEARKRQRRQEIESRIDAKAAEEKAAARQERADLFRQRKQQQVELGLLQQKMRMMHEFEDWKEEQIKMVDFIRTENNPPIFYRPKGDNPESETRKNATKAKIMERIEERRRFMEEEYAELAAARRRRLGIAVESETVPPPPLPVPAPGGDQASPQRYVHIIKKTAAPPTTADFEDLEDEPVLMDEEPDRRIVSLE